MALKTVFQIRLPVENGHGLKVNYVLSFFLYERFEAICTLNDEEVFAEHLPTRVST